MFFQRYLWTACLAAAFSFLCTANERTWTSVSGKTLKGDFVRFEGENVVVKLSESDKEKSIPVARFSEKDRIYLETLKQAAEEPAAMDSGAAAEELPFSPKAVEAKFNQLKENPQQAIIIGSAMFVLGLPLFFLYWKVIFGDMQEFQESLRYVLTPDFISFFRGEGLSDWWQTMKFNIWIGLCALTLAGEGYIVLKYML